MSKLGDLPISVVQQLCKHLNVEGAGVRNWRDLIAQPPVCYDVFAADGFARNGLRPHTSPADQVLLDFSAQGITVDQLYVMLGGIEAWACRTILEHYVSRPLLKGQGSTGDHDNHHFPPGGGVASSESTPSPDEHPKYGPLPSVAPPSTSSEQHHGGYPDTKNYHENNHYYGNMHFPPVNDQQVPLSMGSNPQVLAGPGQVFHSATASSSSSPMSAPESLPLYFYGNGQPHPPDMGYFGDHQQLPYGTGYLPHPLHPGHMTRTSSDGSALFNSISSGTTYTDYTGGGYVSSEQGSRYNNNNEHGSVYSSSEQGSKYSGSGQGSKYSLVPASTDCTTPSELGSKVSFGGGGLNILQFSYVELSEATHGFTEGMVGIGSFGTVFKARVRGNGPYAIKKLHSERELGEHCVLYDSFHRETFLQELQLLTRYHHRNILSLVAYSNDGYLPCLVYEFMEYGSLAECLQGKRGVCLKWEERLRIAADVADALHFLHTVNAPTALVHGDVKSANILLDVHFVPKLSDFGLARELTGQSGRSSSTLSSRSAVVRGTMAYMAPEFVRNRKLTPRTDVYAYGVVLLELHTGQPALSEDKTVEEPVLTERLYNILEDSESNKDQVLRVADERAGWPQEIGVALFDIITVCLHKRTSKRLPIKEVLDQLVTLLPQACPPR